MFVLAIDTSSPAVVAGVVYLGDDADEALSLAGARAPLAARGHGELLAPAIVESLADAELPATSIAAVVAGVGPGPYTGLRVGLVTAAAFADAIGIPTYGVGSLDAIAEAAPEKNGLLVATDARRREVYWARYAAGRGVDGPHVDRPADVPIDGLHAVAGAAGEQYADVWPQLPQLEPHYPDPVALVSLAAERVRAQRPGEVLTPRYLRHPDAVVPGAPKAVSQATPR